MELARRFIRESPPGSGVIVAGRSHYFDSIAEMRTGLDLTQDVQVLQLGEFNDDQMKKYLSSLGSAGELPSWVPSRPLFLGHLAVRGGLAKLTLDSTLLDQASGWDFLLDCICHREAELETGVESQSVRRIIEELAIICQRSFDGLGPFNSEDLDSAFKRACGYPPSDRDKILLMRFPGLGLPDEDTGQRHFVDADLAEAALGSAMFAFIDSPFDKKWAQDYWQGTIKPLGARVAAKIINERKIPGGKIDGALERAQKHYAQTPLATNILIIATHIRHYPMTNVNVDTQLIDHLEISNDCIHFHKITFRDCLFSLLEIDYDFADKSLPVFDSCTIGTLLGRGKAWLESSVVFANCEVEEVDDEDQITTASIMELSLPSYSKVVISILKKVYAQSGKARKGNAFSRGVGQSAQQHVPTAIDNLKSAGFIIKVPSSGEPLWTSSKDKTIKKRVRSILGAANSSTDSILLEN
jgi:hypothetical protein